MKKGTALILMVTVALSVCCNIFGNDSSGGSSEWKKTSLPGQLRGDWYVNGIYDMKVTSSKVTMSNRVWIIYSIDKREEEYRIVLRSSFEYKAMYIKNLTDTSAERTFGWGMNTSYDAKQAGIGEWITITKV